MNNENWNTIASIASNYKSIIRIGLFGSHARGDATPTSDLDIVYDYIMNDSEMTSNMMDCLTEIQDAFPEKIDFVAYYLLLRNDGDEYDKEFRKNLQNELVWIYEK